MSTTQEITEQVKQASQWIKPLQDEIARVIIGQKYLVDGLVHWIADERPHPAPRGCPAWRKR